MRAWLRLAAAVLTVWFCGAPGGYAAAEQPPRGARNCETRASVEVYPPVWHYVVSGERGANYALTSTRTQCEVDGRTVDFRRYGLTQRANQVVEDRYDAVAPYSMTAALVKREDGRWINYTFGQGEVGRALPYDRVVSLRANENCELGLRPQVHSPDVAVALSAPGADGKRTAYVYLGDGEPSPIPGLGGPGIDVPIERFRNMLIGRWSDPDGSIRHRLYSIAGRPLSPVLGEITRWATMTDPEERHLAPVCNGTVAVDLFTVGPILDEDPNQLWVGPLLTPIGADGAPMPLPEGAIGVFPVTPWPYADAPTPPPGRLLAPYRHTRVWAIAYPTPQSFEFTLHEGRLGDAIAASPSAQRFPVLGRADWLAPDSPEAIFYGYPLLLPMTAEGVWHGFGYFRSEARGALSTDFNVAIQNTRNAVSQNLAAERAAWEAEQERVRAESLARFDANFATGVACNFVPPWNLDRDRIARHATTCPQIYNLDDRARLRSSGYPAHVIDVVEAYHAAANAREQAYQAEQAELARNYVPPGAWEGALRAASDQQVRDIAQSTDNWLDQRRAQQNADWQRSQRAY